MSAQRRNSLCHIATTRGSFWLGAAHFVVDAVCVTAVLRAAPLSETLVSGAFAFVLGYDLLAFAGQAPLGWLIDRWSLRRTASLLGLVLTTAALLAGPSGGLAVMLLAGAGNALFHVGAGAMVLAGAGDKASPAGIFVAPGALGLGLGLMLGRKFLTVPLWPFLFALAASMVAVLVVSKRSEESPPEPASGASAKTAGEPARARGAVVLIVTLLSLSVAVRSLVGTVGCDGCPRSFLLIVALPVAAFAGKLLGGFLADRFGWMDLAITALLASAPLLAFSGGELWLALPGLLVFQLTMPVTLTATLRAMPARPGFGFGVLCLALVAGTLPAYLPGGWRPHGLPLFFLVLGSAAALYLALRMLLPPPRRRISSSATSAQTSSPATLCRGEP